MGIYRGIKQNIFFPKFTNCIKCLFLYVKLYKENAKADCAFNLLYILIICFHGHFSHLGLDLKLESPYGFPLFFCFCGESGFLFFRPPSTFIFSCLFQKISHLTYPCPELLIYWIVTSQGSSQVIHLHCIINC